MIGYCSKSFPNMEEIMHDGPWRTYQVVVAATCNMGIGKDGKLPWRLPSDLKFFKELTVTASDPDKMNAVVMGRKTWESIPLQFRPPPGRLNVVLTRSGSFDVPSAENIAILREALNAPQCDAIHITEIETNIECDTFIPPINFSVFQPWYSSSPIVENDIRHSFVTYVCMRSSSIQEKSNCSSETKKLEVERFTFLPKMIFEKHDEYVYLRLVEEIISNGTQKDDGTGTHTLSKFGCQMRFNLRKSFPLLTTKTLCW
ncbi:Bifunctional dihydrofolate reductase-thymidylate synthase [Quillaja saponaria]|uniref:dihydrofolate reductase n=1 Tax=Quillaja saponaria TaxID=32244 RepID=A0AAD7LH71_QUISA|nr:Bifunctional dihydrofolate reductase-thymidylate synthase [Quillaja saponaria]